MIICKLRSHAISKINTDGHGNYEQPAFITKHQKKRSGGRQQGNCARSDTERHVCSSGQNSRTQTGKRADARAHQRKTKTGRYKKSIHQPGAQSRAEASAQNSQPQIIRFRLRLRHMKCCRSLLPNWLRRRRNWRWNWNISSRGNRRCGRINAQSTHDWHSRDHCHGNCGRLTWKVLRQKIVRRVRAIHATTWTRDAHRHPPADRFHVEFIFRAAAAKDFEFHKFSG